MKQSNSVIITVILSAIVAYAVGRIHPVSSPVTPEPTTHETSYERVVHSGTLRCGYQYWDGAVMRDEKSGQIFGPWVDIMNAVGAATDLKIEWAEQVSWSDVGAALKSGKIDAMCAGMWTSAAKAKEISFTTPVAYQALEAFVRGDDHRFDAGLDNLNNENIKISVIENDNSDFIAKQDYPKAQRAALGQSFANDSDLLMDVMTGKGDTTFVVTGLWQQFNKNNPDKIRRLAPDHKLRVFGLANAINNDDPRLLSLLNAGEQEIQNSGLLDKILDKANADYPDMYIKPLKPFP